MLHAWEPLPAVAVADPPDAGIVLLIILPAVTCPYVVTPPVVPVTALPLVTLLEAEAVLEVWPELVAVTVTVSVVRFVPILLWEMIFPDKLNLLLPFPVRVIVVVPATLLV